MRLPVPAKEIKVEDALVLKFLSQESAQTIFTVIDTNRHRLREWLPFVDNTWKVTDTELFIKSVLESPLPKRELVYEIRLEKQFIGLIALKEIDRWNKKAELGYWMDPHFEGRGIMTKCCKALISNAFSKIGLRRIQIKAGIGNARSCRIPESLGFRFEGIERSGERFNDHYKDLEVFSMLREDWLKFLAPKL